MPKSIIGKKIGMTSIFQEGIMIPVTVIKAGPCFVTQIKTKDKDGYNGFQVGFLEKKLKHTTKPLIGHFKKSEMSPLKILKEISIENKEELKLGEKLTVELFSKGEYVDITSKSKGKGFAGTIKRYGFHRGPMSHGSRHHRRGGSLGSMAPAHVFKGHKMPGRMGSDKVTLQNLMVMDIIPENDLILIKGAIPGSKHSIVIIKSSIKKYKEAK